MATFWGVNAELPSSGKLLTSVSPDAKLTLVAKSTIIRERHKIVPNLFIIYCSS